ncbi:Putative aminoacrylate hydrolase RutD [Acaryochloris thomasi RCC1774]|uniref:Aminoacrylate hydrolase RutD n=1 Tax=Acaryochloris thomasi RCC1774 TaxID=1764569 RepID=A0A2W1JFR2_9CYAN|nr:alpha/beta hydrolase [Acaryochloris thomasi]PZD72428.1 Putative aminoacrylate hydrolase RutD [Acaryochloris thomasi RCC1774]
MLVSTYLLLLTTLYQVVACQREQRQKPPGQRVDVGGYALHLSVSGEGESTIVLDHSLGGVEGYLLLQKLAPLGRVVTWDRAGYGWSDHSPHPRTSGQIVQELETALAKADIQPPYILVGDSFGSYNMRLYAHQFPEQVQGLVLTDGLHEVGMLKMSWPLQILKLIFISGFLMSILGAGFGIIRLLRLLQVFELLKPNLRQFSRSELTPVTRSFCRPKHWLTMARELWSMDASGRQLRVANNLGSLPIVSIKSHSFFTPSFWTFCIPLKGINQLRDQIHHALMGLSTDCTQLPADESSHFVWVDQPEVMVQAVQLVLNKISR